MNEILDFLFSHWLLSGLFVLAVIAYAAYEYWLGSGSNAVSAEQAVALMNHQHGVVFDVRTAQQFADGHILGAQHVDADAAETKFNKLNKYTHKPVIVVNANGRGNEALINRLKTHGFKEVFNLNGGLQAWQDAGLPLSRE